MPDREPTPEQWRAIRAEGSVAVRAGAGSGKTTVLAHHFLHLLRPRPEGAPLVDEVGRILAITFTEKAAAEMKQKIHALLAVELGRATGPERRHWERVRRELLAARVSTIHAFCARLLRENPLEAGIDPRATILDEHESQAYVEAAVEEELVARVRGGDPAGRELVLRHGLRRGRQGGAVGVCVRLLASLGRTGRNGVWLAAAMERQEALAPVATAALREAAERIAARVRAALGAARDTPTIGRLRATWPAYEAMLEEIGRGGAATPVVETLRLEEFCRLLGAARLTGTVRDDLAYDGLRLRGVLAEEYGFLAAFAPARRLTELLAALGGTLRERKRVDGVLAFDDLIAEARALLADHPAVGARCARELCAILVDEFQDTDAVQAEVIEMLASPGVPLFVVGDEKQSIYGFRGADVTVFRRAWERLGGALPLGRNFRSQPAILDFVNALAAVTMRVPATSPDPGRWTVFDPEQRLVADRSAEAARPGVSLVTFAREHARRSLSAAEARELEARVLAGVIIALHERREHPVRYGDIAVLFRALDQVKAYEYALRRSAVPHYVVKGRGFFQCQEVRDVASLLATIADPRDGVALAAVLRSPFFAIDDATLARLAWPAGAVRPALTRRFGSGESFADLDEAGPGLVAIRDLLRRLRTLRSRATIAELIAEALAATDFEAVCLTQFQGPQKVANVRKLIELARDAERRRFFTLRDFVALVHELGEREAREPEAQLVGEQDDVVRLMTIHQAKGLEFPVVVLVDLGRRLERDNDTAVIDEELGVLVAPVAGAGLHPQSQARLEAYRLRAWDRTRAEHARLLYVACTRARDELVLLEGKGNNRYLQSGEGDRYVWCHQVWDLLGREPLAAFVAGDAGETVLPVPDGGEVRVTAAARYLERPTTEPVGAPAPVEAPATDAERGFVARVLDFTPPTPSEVVTSPTALADFRRCPRQFWYRHVIALPERGTGGLRATLLGTAAHGVLEAVDLGNAGEADIDGELAARPETLVLQSGELARLATDLRAAAAGIGAEIGAGLEILGREVPFVLPLPRHQPRVFLQGRIDVLARRGGRLLVRDYKYARPSDAAVAAYADQLAAYRLAIAPDAAGELVFLRGGLAVRALPALDVEAQVGGLIEAGVALGAAMASGEPSAFPKRPPAPVVCERLGCGYVRRCWKPADH
jgi:ATP-dependent helicase/nuclease subunit A